MFFCVSGVAMAAQREVPRLQKTLISDLSAIRVFDYGK